ncbi:BZ3500_MvSof-1268-A1-R1_Chr5-2g07807 [Microbotryum saponariae]|uniref:BZ3500_MvSof-1268-A1-R1_Chr5-2g07807 protein n=1 Tax=Microbotryum saponariae TaxID=289078 RepID=A0A2X0NIW2_9BASI|nr:BZ3500_MvSof-1268-A1-R1_Chr5-2g07807 [Microbotryum saponariae]SDA05676.1 BZ3501_MvSof-1269-A2-R1_Chr5-2g07629 [Microbotryum saponariae]
MDPSRALELVCDREGTPAESAPAAPRRTTQNGVFALPHQQASRKTAIKTNTKGPGSTSKRSLASTPPCAPLQSSSSKAKAEPPRFATPSGGVRGRFVPGDSKSPAFGSEPALNETFVTPSKANVRRSARSVRSSRTGEASASHPTHAPGTRSSQDVDEQDLSVFSYKNITSQVSSSQTEVDDPGPSFDSAARVTTSTKVVAAESATANAKGLRHNGEEAEAGDDEAILLQNSSPPGTYGSDAEFSDIAQSHRVVTQEGFVTEHDDNHEERDHDGGTYSEDEGIFRESLSPVPQEAGDESQAHPDASSGAGSQMDSRSSVEYERDSKRPRTELHETWSSVTLDPLCPTPSIFPGASPYLDRARTRVRTMEEQNVEVDERTMTDEQWREKGQELAVRAGKLIQNVIELKVNQHARAERLRKNMLTVKSALAMEQVELDKSREGLLQWVTPVLTMGGTRRKGSEEPLGNETARATTKDEGAT